MNLCSLTYTNTVRRSNILQIIRQNLNIWKWRCFLAPSLVRVNFSFAPGYYRTYLDLTGGVNGDTEETKEKDRQKVGSSVLGAWVEIPNSNCFFFSTLFFKILLLAALYFFFFFFF
jgi:hypothetical protein